MQESFTDATRLGTLIAIYQTDVVHDTRPPQPHMALMPDFCGDLSHITVACQRTLNVMYLNDPKGPDEDS